MSKLSSCGRKFRTFLHFFMTKARFYWAPTTDYTPKLLRWTQWAWAGKTPGQDTGCDFSDEYAQPFYKLATTVEANASQNDRYRGSIILIWFYRTKTKMRHFLHSSINSFYSSMAFIACCKILQFASNSNGFFCNPSCAHFRIRLCIIIIIRTLVCSTQIDGQFLLNISQNMNFLKMT